MNTRIARRALVLVLLVASGARPAVAQAPRTTVAGGYSFVRDIGAGATPSTDYPTGWFASVTQQIGFRRLSVMGEVTSSSRENAAVEVQRLTAFLGGARVSLAHLARLETYTVALVGVERFSEPGFNESRVAFQPGAGLELPIWKALGARAEVGYRMVRRNGVTFKEVTAVAGGTIRFGNSARGASARRLGRRTSSPDHDR